MEQTEQTEQTEQIEQNENNTENESTFMERNIEQVPQSQLEFQKEITRELTTEKDLKPEMVEVNSDKEASVVSRTSFKSNYNYKEIQQRQEVANMSSDTDLVQDDVKIVVSSSKHHNHHKHHQKSKPNFMKEGPKYEEEL